MIPKASNGRPRAFAEPASCLREQVVVYVKSDPSGQILVAAIAGPATPYIVHWRAPPVLGTGPWPEVTHSCGSEAAPASFADPGVRLQKFVKEFGGNGLIYPFYSTNYGPALRRN